MDPTIPYIACVIGAAALYLVLRPGPRSLKALGALAGLGAFAWVVVSAADWMVGPSATGADRRPEVFFFIFSLIAVACAVRMITHPKPVYCALYFVMVVLSSAGLFLLLEAEFMAFALIIVYAGAILITYMFVLMLAQQSPTVEGQPEYDRVPREPGYAASVGFIMLVLLTHMVFDGGGTLMPRPHAVPFVPEKLRAAVESQFPGAVMAHNAVPTFRDGVVVIDLIEPGRDVAVTREIPASALPSNIQAVGLDLVAKFPASLELAGIILLLAMFGAVVLARKQIELGEDEVREAAGMRRLGLHGHEHDEHHPASRAAVPTSGGVNGGRA